MQCPACRTTPLQPTKLDDGLLAHGCPQCSGALVALLYYRVSRRMMSHSRRLKLCLPARVSRR